MTTARPALSLALLVACATHGDQPGPAAPPPPPELGPAKWTPLPPASNDPVDTSIPPAGFWTQGQAACPEGATFRPSAAPYFTASCTTADGRYDGPMATFDAEGRLLVLERYVVGEAEGVHLAFWPGGKKRREQAWHRGKEHGPFTRWYEDGTKAEEGEYRDGRLVGTLRAWDAGGELLGAATFTAGSGVYTEWHANGNRARERTYVDGLEHGLRTQWHANGQKSEETQIDHGVQHGRHAAWDPAGQPLQSGFYKNDKQAGPWTFHGPGGAVVRVDTYEDGDVVSSVAYQDGAPLARPAADQACAAPAGLAAAFKAATGEPLDDGGRHCVRRAVHFPGVVAIGGFANDHGCVAMGTMVDCAYHEAIDGAAILARAGWKRANAAAREQIARDYVAEVGLVWNMSGDPDVDRQPNGDLVVTGSVQIVGMSGTSSYTQKFRISPAGGVTRDAAR